MKRPFLLRAAALLLLVLLACGAQAQGRKTGAVIDPSIYQRVPSKSTLVRGLYTFPPSASVKQYAPYCGDQGQYSTCTGWASAYSALTIVYAKLNGITDRAAITRSAFSPGFAFRASFTDSFIGCDSGQVTSLVLKAIQDNGAPRFSDLDSLCPSTIPLASYEKARTYSILGFTRLLSTDDTADIVVQKVKKSIAEGKPVVVVMFVDDAPRKGPYAALSKDYVWIPDRSVEPTAGHAMTVVSYDDARGGGSFELQNSWGRSWGNDGFFWIRYADFAGYVAEAYELVENPSMVHPEGSRLSGALAIQGSDGRDYDVAWNGSAYVVKRDIPSGTRFRLYLDNNEPAFVYLIDVDAAWKTFRLFPSDPSISPALTYARNRVALPGEDLFLQADENPGEERMVVLYSLREINLDTVEYTIQNGSGSLTDRLKVALGDALVPFDKVAYDPARMSFTANGRTNGVVALLVSINHTP